MGGLESDDGEKKFGRGPVTQAQPRGRVGKWPGRRPDRFVFVVRVSPRNNFLSAYVLTCPVFPDLHAMGVCDMHGESARHSCVYGRGLEFRTGVELRSRRIFDK